VKGPWRCRVRCGRGCGGRASYPRPPERGLEGDFASAPAGEWRDASCVGDGRGRRRGTGCEHATRSERAELGTRHHRRYSAWLKSLAIATVGCSPLCGLGSPGLMFELFFSKDELFAGQTRVFLFAVNDNEINYHGQIFYETIIMANYHPKSKS
jgi:hypothetical protein